MTSKTKMQKFQNWHSWCVKEFYFSLESLLNLKNSSLYKERNSMPNPLCEVFLTEQNQGIVVLVEVGAVKVYVATVEALRKKERGDQNRMKLSLPQQMVLFWVSPSPPSPTSSMLMYFFAGLKKNLTQFWTKLRVLVLCFPDFTDFPNNQQKLVINKGSYINLQGIDKQVTVRNVSKCLLQEIEVFK